MRLVALLLALVASPHFAAPAAVAPVAAAASGAPVTGVWVHAFAAYGQPKHPPGFTHFDYVNPDAPKGGTMYLSQPDRRSSFDKFNYFTLKGNPPAGMMLYMHESLAVRGADEPLTMYGVLAESMMVAPDKSAITFRLNPKARFSNGDPVLAADVKYSFDSVSGPKADPNWQTNFSGVAAAVVIDDRTIRFDLKERSNDALFKVGTLLPVFSRKWAPGPDGQPKPFDEIINEYPLTSGPYTIALADSGRRIEFKRNPDYWGRDLPTRRGHFNFDRVVYRYYQDEDVSTEAFKAGEFDILRAYAIRSFLRQHRGPKWDDGRIIRTIFATDTGQAIQSYHFNLRRPIFQDIRVRKALVLSYDFETGNRSKMFKRSNSVFNNSEFAAEGLPSPGELALLEPFRAELPKEVFGPPFVAPRTDSDPNALRRNLLQARAMFEEAGWKIGPDGVLRNAKGEPFEFEYLSPGESTVREAAWQRNLDKLGIRLKIRKVDYALFGRRAEEFDFDIMTIVEGRFTVPSAQDFTRLYHSKGADEKGSDNTRGVKSKAVDHILAAMNRAETMQELRDATRALDRVVMWNYWQMPELYSSNILVSYWNKFGIPAKRPRFFTVSVTPDLDPQLAWPQLTWWAKQP
jgi:peptide/nickel transport system substrate-binding protein/microcin C transport system substrate-binding protein